MENLYNELVGFSIVALVIFMLAYYTKKKEEQFRAENEEQIRKQNEKNINKKD